MIRRLMLLVWCLTLCMPVVAGGAGTEGATPETITFPKIDRRPAGANWNRGSLSAVPSYEPDSRDPWQMDLRGFDCSDLDLSESLEVLLQATFDSRTVWPPAERMPKDYDWRRIMELGKNPGLSVRQLHAKGITGRGVGIAIIDQALLTEHQEYAGRLRFYEEINVKPHTPAQMHGPAVASIAVGKNVGVAPEATLYYIGTWAGDFGAGPNGFTYNFNYKAEAIRRILDINRQLPDNEKIRVISISVGWKPGQKGYKAITAAVEDAKAAGMFVVCSSLESVHGFKFHGLSRDPLADPDVFTSYEPGTWWAKDYYEGARFTDRLLAPMGSRTTASFGGPDEYVFYRQGGWSWTIPYIAATYALAVQVDPSITPERFWKTAMQTGQTIELQHDGETIPLGPILDPVALIAALS